MQEKNISVHDHKQPCMCGPLSFVMCSINKFPVIQCQYEILVTFLVCPGADLTDLISFMMTDLINRDSNAGCMFLQPPVLIHQSDCCCSVPSGAESRKSDR